MSAPTKDEQIATLQTKLTEARALAEAGYMEGGLKGAAYARLEHSDTIYEAWAKSDTRAAIERLKLEAK
jgi:hypothetical protein